MKKILIVNNNLEIGGVQTSLINLIKEIHNSYEITLLLFHNKEMYEDLVPQNVKIIETKSQFKHFGMSKQDTKGSPLLYIERAFWFVLCKLFGRSFVVGLMSFFQKDLTGFDVAISFLHEHDQKILYGGCNEFVLKNVKASVKIAWIHCDFELSGANNLHSYKIYRQFDKIIACSNGARNSFVKCLPDLATKCVAIRNCNDYALIKELAGNGVDYGTNVFNLVTVARLSEEKGIDRSIKAVQYCLERGCKIRYHIIGGGKEENSLKAMVESLGLSSCVFFYGDQKNPYKYIKNADLLILTSYHEAAPMVFDEAMSLGVPVFTTETTSTEEMVSSVGGGFVCANEQSAINEQLYGILQCPNKLVFVKDELKKHTFNNFSIVEKIAQILN